MARLKDNVLTKKYSRARRSRDARFDGLFFIAVKTTGIYCRPVCPAKTPLEKNIEYYATAVSAAVAGFRPCLRCRPDSAPNSWGWLGTETTFKRALSMIQAGELRSGKLSQFAERLGISDRYLRVLFQKYLGISPTKYANYVRCLFAKQLLHESALPITQIAFAAGFKSVRRFNEAFYAEMGLAPRNIRKTKRSATNRICLRLHFRPPYAKRELFEFLRFRSVEGMEWGDHKSYGRTIQTKGYKGYFEIMDEPDKNYFNLHVELDNVVHLAKVVTRVRQLFDTDAPIAVIDQHLRSFIDDQFCYQPGLRVPGVWCAFESGVRAILGQQVSVKQAHHLLSSLVENLGEQVVFDGTSGRTFFPTPEAILESDLSFFKMPQARKNAVHNLARHVIDSNDANDIDQWLELKGIGEWTVKYVKLRATKDPDVWLSSDAGIKNVLAMYPDLENAERASPWRSYLTFQLWNQLL